MIERNGVGERVKTSEKMLKIQRRNICNSFFINELILQTTAGFFLNNEFDEVKKRPNLRRIEYINVSGCASSNIP